MPMETFGSILARHGLSLTRGDTHILQVNVGLLCNQRCRHCHLDAGPNRPEIMDAATVREVIAFAARHRFQVIDVTGGAPEMNPHLGEMLRRFSDLAPRVMLRSNLTAISDPQRQPLLDICRDHRIVIVASLPSVNAAQTDAQRGDGVNERSLAALRRLNELGYGRHGSGLELNLVSNPSGAFLPAGQAQAEKKFRGDLQRKYGIQFNDLYTLTNAPLGRFRRWLVESGNYDSYLERLASSFNPCTIPGLMCRSLISISWDGYLFDCDFHLSSGLYACGRKTHVSQLEHPPEVGTPIVPAEHCFACTAGAGFT
jgi:radical SAM/Cys-rich protein